MHGAESLDITRRSAEGATDDFNVEAAQPGRKKAHTATQIVVDTNESNA